MIPFLSIKRWLKKGVRKWRFIFTMGFIWEYFWCKLIAHGVRKRCTRLIAFTLLLKANSILLRPVPVKSYFVKFRNGAKKNLNYFCKALHGRCLTGFWIYLRSWIYQGTEIGSGFNYAKVLHVAGFWICESSELVRSLNLAGFSVYRGFECVMVLNMPRFWIYQGSENTKILNIPRLWICQGSEYTRIPNISGFWIYQGSEYARVLNMLGLWLYRRFEYAGITQLSQCVWISLDSSCICLIIIKYARMLNTNSTLLWLVSRRLLFPIFENSAKKKKKKKIILFS